MGTGVVVFAVVTNEPASAKAEAERENEDLSDHLDSPLFERDERKLCHSLSERSSSSVSNEESKVMRRVKIRNTTKKPISAISIICCPLNGWSPTSALGGDLKKSGY